MSNQKGIRIMLNFNQFNDCVNGVGNLSQPVGRAVTGSGANATWFTAFVDGDFETGAVHRTAKTGEVKLRLKSRTTDDVYHVMVNMHSLSDALGGVRALNKRVGKGVLGRGDSEQWFALFPYSDFKTGRVKRTKENEIRLRLKPSQF